MAEPRWVHVSFWALTSAPFTEMDEDALARLGGKLGSAVQAEAVDSIVVVPSRGDELDREAAAELRAENQRLRAELDAKTGRHVIMVPEWAIQAGMDGCRDEADGTILRTTGTGREWVKHGSDWEEQVT